ncbi:hypothetical protein PG994_015410 [Apiospora phragmitis]|uniref:Uncharacterized protein n=1 Tax=Apiospora phragmitis TaxID=2905665 RepID=A0ABR1SQN5_9PEZI
MPMIPRDQLYGLDIPDDMNRRKAISDVDALQQIPSKPLIEESVLFTLEPEKKEMGVLAVHVMCGWLHGEPRFEPDPVVVLAGLLGVRKLHCMTPKGRSDSNSTTMSHMNPRELVNYTSGFKVRIDSVLVLAGSRTDLQVLAAGCYLGLPTVIVLNEWGGCWTSKVGNSAETP